MTKKIFLYISDGRGKSEQEKQDNQLIVSLGMKCYFQIFYNKIK